MRVVFDSLRDGLASINNAASKMAEAQHELATGRRLRSISVDPLAARGAVAEHTALGALDSFTRTSGNATARLATADSVLNGYVDKLSEIIVAGSAAHGSHSTPTSRSALSTQVRDLRDSLVSDINTKFGSGYLFSGTEVGTAAYANVGGVWTYQGNNQTSQVEVQSGRQVASTFDGQAIAQGTAAADVFTLSEQLATHIDNNDVAGISAVIDELDVAFDRALRAQAAVGSDQRVVIDSEARTADLRRAAQIRRSQLEDADIAEAVTRLSQAETAYQGALGAVSRNERLTLLDYLR